MSQTAEEKPKEQLVKVEERDNEAQLRASSKSLLKTEVNDTQAPDGETKHVSVICNKCNKECQRRVVSRKTPNFGKAYHVCGPCKSNIVWEEAIPTGLKEYKIPTADTSAGIDSSIDKIQVFCSKCKSLCSKVSTLDNRQSFKCAPCRSGPLAFEDELTPGMHYPPFIYEVKCSICSKQCKRRIVQASNQANAGRAYYICVPCDKWKCFEDVLEDKKARVAEKKATGTLRPSPYARPSPYKCNCGNPARGPIPVRNGMSHNRGRRFYACAGYATKDKTDCGYRIWADGTEFFGPESQQRFNEYHDSWLSAMFCAFN